MDIFIFNEKNELNKFHYFSTFLNIILVLRNDLNADDIGNLKNTLESDWKKDSNGKSKMTKEELFNSLFQLADIWTPEIDKDQ